MLVDRACCWQTSASGWLGTSALIRSSTSDHNNGWGLGSASLIKPDHPGGEWGTFREISLGTGAKHQNGNLRWYLPLGVRPPAPLNGTNFQTSFYPTFFLLQLNPTYMKRILHLVPIKNIVVKSSFNWFKIDIHQQLRPLTANYLAMFKVTSTTIYT